MIRAYEEACLQKSTDGADSSSVSLRRRAYFLAIASFICNLVSIIFCLLHLFEFVLIGDC